MPGPLNTCHAEIDKSRIRIDPEEIAKLLGDQADLVDGYTLGLIDQYIARTLDLSSPSGAYVLADALESKSNRVIKASGITFNSGKIIHKMVKDSTSYAFFLVTAGPEPEKLARRLISEGNYLEGYLVDLAASALVDLAADLLQEQLQNRVQSEGSQITNRYSPGYCGWDVEEQQKLFRLFPEGCCGISLSASSLMNPVKSISGIIGIGARVSYRDYTCELCAMKDCHFRRVRDPQ
jgi:hypothetical protein